MEAAASSNDRRWFPSDAAWLAIPRTAGRLLLRHWPQLLFWGVLQWLLYGLAMQFSISISIINNCISTYIPCCFIFMSILILMLFMFEFLLDE